MGRGRVLIPICMSLTTVCRARMQPVKELAEPNRIAHQKPGTVPIKTKNTRSRIIGLKFTKNTTCGRLDYCFCVCHFYKAHQSDLIPPFSHPQKNRASSTSTRAPCSTRSTPTSLPWATRRTRAPSRPPRLWVRSVYVDVCVCVYVSVCMCPKRKNFYKCHLVCLIIESLGLKRSIA